MQLNLRPWTADDLDELVASANNEKIARNMTDSFPHPYGPAQGEAFIAFANKNNPVTILAIEVDGQVVGSIGLHPQQDIQRKNAELGYWLGELHWGKGIITQAVRQMVEYGFKNLDITRIYARPFGTNIASQRVLEKAGFKLEGRYEQTLFKNGQFIDELVYAVRK